MAYSTLTAKPVKPYEGFPLFPHANGRWAKKIRGKLVYFGRWDEPDAALQKFLDQRDDLYAGRTPRASNIGLTVKDLANRFLAMQEQRKDAQEIRHRTFEELFNTCAMIQGAFGSKRLVEDLASDDFENLRAALAKRYGVHRLANEIQRTRSLFKYAFDAGLIERPVRIGPAFKRPAKRIMRAHRQASGPRMWEAKEIRTMFYAADQPLQAMILLAVNCGFGNHDCGTLPQSALDLSRGWVSFPRPKTAIERRCPLWPETIEIIEDAMRQRPKATKSVASGLVFITKYGAGWSKQTNTNPISQEFRKLLNKLHLHSPGKGFYTLRHVFQTIADEARDPVATRFIMGHADSSMSGVYRERISDERLLAVVNYVHAWLFPRPTVLS